jgi:WD40 repeat protein
VPRTSEIFYFTRSRAAAAEVRSVSPGGGAPRTVAKDVFGPRFAVSPDGQAVVFSALRDGELRLFQVGGAGGAPRLLTDYHAEIPAFSPDGKKLAFYYIDSKTNRFRIGIVAAGGGPIEKSFDCVAPNFTTRLLFREDGLYLNSMANDRANVWLQPLDGKPPRRVTDFDDFLLYDFAFSPDGRSLALSRGPRRRDALLVRGFA